MFYVKNMTKKTSKDQNDLVPNCRHILSDLFSLSSLFIIHCQLLFCSFASCRMFVPVSGLWREVGNFPVSVAHSAVVLNKATPRLNTLALKIEENSHV